MRERVSSPSAVAAAPRKGSEKSLRAVLDGAAAELEVGLCVGGRGGSLGRRTGMPAALAAVKPASAAASGRQRSHSCWCGARGGSRCARKMMILEKYDDFVMILMMCHDVS